MNDGVGSDRLGWSVAISGNTIVAGAPFHTEDLSANQGAVYVFVMPPAGGSVGNQTAELTMNDGAESDELGWSVAIRATRSSPALPSIWSVGTRTGVRRMCS